MTVSRIGAPPPERLAGAPLAGGGVRPSRRLVAAGLLLLFACTALAYLPALRAGFLPIWDDGEYVLNNTLLRSGDGLRRIWLEPRATPQYYPLVHTSFWVEHRLWGLEPAGYHAVNVALHAANAALAGAVLSALAVPGAWAAAAVFALHPVHVESVAWVTERKNLLSGLFYLSSLLCLLRFFRPAPPGSAPEPGTRPWTLYAAGAALFAAALLCKTVTLTLPAALLLLLWWKRGRVEPRELLLTAPLLAAGVAMGLLTAALEKHHVGAQGADWGFSLVERLLIAGRAAWFYLGKLLLPRGLTFIYPRWEIDAGVWWQYLFPAVWALLLAALWAARGRAGRGPLAAALIFLVTLAPALGFVDFYPMRYSFVADHFQYLASLAPIALAAALAARALPAVAPAPAAGADTLAHRLRRALPALAPAGAVLAVLAALTWRQSGYYRDQETLSRQNIRENPRSWVGHGTLAAVLTEQRRIDEALEHARTAVELNPTDPDNLNLLGTVLSKKGRYDEALQSFREALRHDGDNLAAQKNIAYVTSLRDYMLRARPGGR